GSPLALLAFPRVRLRVHNPDAGGRDEDVVDVASAAGNEPVVERDHTLANFSSDVAREPALAFTAFAPARLGVACGHGLSDRRRMVAVPAPHLVHLALGSTCAFRRGGCASLARLEDQARIADAAGHGLCRTVPDRIGTLGERDPARCTRRGIAQPKLARRLVIDP